MNLLWTIAAFLLALGPLIVFHELGHYTVARLCGVKVLRFSLGFGRPLVKWVAGRDKTEWRLSLIPFGGYVAMLDERETHGVPIPEADLPRAFNRKHVAKRIAIVAAGPLANLLLAILLYAGINMVGVDEPRALFAAAPAGTDVPAGLAAPFEVTAIDGDPVRSLVDLRWRLMKVGVDHGAAQLDVRDINAAGVATNAATHKVTIDLSRFETKDLEGDFMAKLGLTPLRSRPSIRDIADPDGPAVAAGLKKGDRIVSVDGKTIDDVDSLQHLISASPGHALSLVVERNGAMLSTSVTPASTGGPGRPGGASATGRIGVLLRAQMETVLVRYGPVDALVHGAKQTWDLCAFSVRMIGKMFTGEVSLKNISGPVTIADYAGQSAHMGLLPFITFIAFISVSLGVMNLMPIPMLDGGHLLYYATEIVTRREPSVRMLEWGQRFGMLLLGGMMVIALYNDFGRLMS